MHSKRKIGGDYKDEDDLGYFLNGWTPPKKGIEIISNEEGDAFIGINYGDAYGSETEVKKILSDIAELKESLKMEKEPSMFNWASDDH